MSDFSKVKNILDRGEQYGAAPGRGCVVYYKHRQVFRHIAGFKDKGRKIPLEGNELFNIFSCTKVMTCAAAMMLLERGRYHLDEPVGKYIPEFYEVTVGGEKADRPVLIRHLFTMSAGLDYTLDDEVIREAGRETGGRYPTLETIRFLSHRPLSFQPGTCFQYSLCHDVLGALIEVWSGMRFYDFVKYEILEPLGMNATFFRVPQEMESRKATLYRYCKDEKCGKVCDQRNPFALGCEYESGGAGIISCLDDYGKFVEMLCNGGMTEDGRQIISRDTIKLMATPVFDKNWQETFVRRTSWGAGYNYGLGVYIVDDASKANSAAARGTFGWDGAAGSYVSVDCQNEIAIFYIQHMYGGFSHAYQDKLRNAVYEEIL